MKKQKNGNIKIYTIINAIITISNIIYKVWKKFLEKFYKNLKILFAYYRKYDIINSTKNR